MNDHATSESLDAQTALLTSLETSLRRDRTERKRSLRIIVVGLIFASIFGLAGGTALWYVIKVRDQNKILVAQIQKVHDQNKIVVDQVHKVQELASVIDPASPRGQAAAKAAVESRLNYLVEQDCRVRRAVAGLSAPKRGDVCVLP